KVTIKERFGTNRNKRRRITNTKIKQRLAHSYRPLPYAGEIIYVMCKRYDPDQTEDKRAEKWAEIAQGKFTLIPIDCTHMELIEERYAREVGQHLSRLIKAPVL
ncbi:MAG: hypothetical protein ABI700_15055, partial [Chloroflexota bacterium]